MEDILLIFNALAITTRIEPCRLGKYGHSILQDGLGQEECVGCMGKGTQQGDKERFLKPRFLGPQFCQRWDLQKWNQEPPPNQPEPGEKMLLVLFAASFPLCNLLETHQCNYPSLSPGPGGFGFQGCHSLGSNWGKSNLFFLFVLLKNY